MHVPEIIEVKELLETLKNEKLVKEWELPYENILTRRSAALFFVAPATEADLEKIGQRLAQFENFSVRDNHEQKLSKLPYRVTFSKEEKEKNETAKQEAQPA